MNIEKIIKESLAGILLLGSVISLNAETIEQQLMRHEGFRSHAYHDRKGNYAIGYGTSLGKPGARQHVEEVRAFGLDHQKLMLKQQSISHEQALKLMYQDISKINSKAISAISNYHQQPKEVKEVIVNMIYCHGFSGFMKYETFRKNIELEDYISAAQALRNSEFYRNKLTRNRAEELRQKLLSVKKTR
ncbi:hypothetical protein FJZ18_00110 [Candidatus Pacearchaeota archaeon]|nr:hypothetical protein [Candidatus Pacearchaeota archaeon]